MASQYIRHSKARQAGRQGKAGRQAAGKGGGGQGKAGKAGGRERERERGQAESGGETKQQQVGGTESVQSEQTNSGGNAVDLDEDIDNFFKSFAERGEGESEDESNAGDVVREERVDVEDEPVLPEETPVEQEPRPRGADRGASQPGAA
ncbi:hypothetical protein WI664_06970 [Vibrio cholerae]